MRMSGQHAIAALIVFGIAALALTSPAVSLVAQQLTARVEPRLALTVETFCSETRVRTTNARIRWSAARAALMAANIVNLAATRQTLDVTVFSEGLDNGQFVSLPIGTASPDRPVAAVVPPAVRPGLRAFQIRLIQIEQPPIGAAADAPVQMGAVVENLEPGVQYTWRLAIDTPNGRIVSPPIDVMARVCPADLVETPPARPTPRRRP